MDSCEEFEIALGARAHGALDPATTAALEKHLAQCEGCRRFEMMANETEDVMTMNTAGNMTWDDVMGKLQRADRHKRWLNALYAVLVAAVITAQVATKRASLPSGTIDMVVLTFGIAACGFAVYRRWRDRSILDEAAREAKNQGETIGYLRAEIDNRIKKLSRLPLVFLFVAVCFGQEAVLKMGRVPLTLSALYGSLAVVALASAGYYQWKILPRLRRQRAELS